MTHRASFTNENIRQLNQCNLILLAINRYQFADSEWASQLNESKCGWWFSHHPQYQIDFVWLETGSILICRNGICVRIELFACRLHLRYRCRRQSWFLLFICLLRFYFDSHWTNLVIDTASYPTTKTFHIVVTVSLLVSLYTRLK